MMTKPGAGSAKIALKDKGIGLMAMPAGLKGKVGYYRWSAI